MIQDLLRDNEYLNVKLNHAIELIQASSTASSSSTKHKACNNLQAAHVILSHLTATTTTAQQQPDTVNSSSSNSNNNSAPKTAKTINEIAAEQMVEQFDWLKAELLDVDAMPTSTPASVATGAVSSEATGIASVCSVGSLEKLERLIARIKAKRLTASYGRLFQSNADDGESLLLNVCNKCKGEIKIV